MLTDLSDLQESDERVWGEPDVSFTVRTRESDSPEIVEREYTFSRAPEWDKWMFTEYEERRADSTNNIRNWRRTRQLSWSDNEKPTVDIPQEVEDKIEELLELDELVLQEP
jgi:hypothetical protein